MSISLVVDVLSVLCRPWCESVVAVVVVVDVPSSQAYRRRLRDISRRRTTLTAASTTLATSARVSCPLCMGNASSRKSSMLRWTRTLESCRQAHMPLTCRWDETANFYVFASVNKIRICSLTPLKPCPTTRSPFNKLCLWSSFVPFLRVLSLYKE